MSIMTGVDAATARAGHGRHARRFARPATERSRLLEERVATFAAALATPAEEAAFERLGETRYLVAGCGAGFTPAEVAALRAWWPTRQLEHQTAARAYWKGRRTRAAATKAVGR